MENLDLLINNASIITMDQNYSVLENYGVGIKDGLISEIGPSNLTSPATKVIDARGQLLLPGLINTHTHVGMSYFKGTSTAMELFRWLKWGWYYIERMDADDIYWASMLSCMEMISAGVTTFSDMYFNEEKIAQAVELTGLRACLGESIIEPTPEMDRGKSLDKQFDVVNNLVQTWDGKAEGRIRIFISPHSPYACSAETLEKCADLVDKYQSRLHIHLSETRGEVEDAYKSWGVSPPQYLNQLGLLNYPIIAAHCVHLSPEDIDTLDRPTFGVAHNIASNLKLQSGIAPIPKMVNRDLAIGLGSDGNGSNDIVDILKDVYLATIIHEWKEEQRPAHACLSMATREGARSLGLDGEIGTIEVGKNADLILVDMNCARTVPMHEPHLGLALTARGDDVHTTIVNGKILMENRKFLTLDSQEVLMEAKNRVKQIFKH